MSEPTGDHLLPWIACALMHSAPERVRIAYTGDRRLTVHLDGRSFLLCREEPEQLGDEPTVVIQEDGGKPVPLACAEWSAASKAVLAYFDLPPLTDATPGARS